MIQPCRFNEWGAAVWQMQLDKLNGANIPEYHFMSYAVDDDKLIEKLRSQMSGKIFKARTHIMTYESVA